LSPRGKFDTEAFVAALDAERGAKNMTWKDVAGETGLSASTLTRLRQGRRPDIDGLASLLAWSGLHAERFIPSARISRPETLTEISASLRSDPRLSAQSAETLERLISSTYDQLRAVEAVSRGQASGPDLNHALRKTKGQQPSRPAKAVRKALA
jgi:transcriptional regulator with XRE-family HTH domain